MVVCMTEREAPDLRAMPLEELAAYVADRQREVNYLDTFISSERISRHSAAFGLLFEALRLAQEQYAEAARVRAERLPREGGFETPVIFRRPGRRKESDDGYSE